MADSEEISSEYSRILDVALQSVTGDGQTEATIQSPYELVALVGHASMVAAGFRLVGLGEEHTLETNTDATVLPKEWNAHRNTYAFRYVPSESSTEYILKINRLGNNAVIMGLAGEDKATSFDLPVNDYISATALPLQLAPGAVNKLKEGFVSRARLEDLISLFKLHVIQKFTPPSVPKEILDGAEYQRTQPEEPPRHDPLRDYQAPAPVRPHPFDDPSAAAPRRPAPVGDFAPPGFEDEFELNSPRRGIVPPFGGGNVPSSGQRDLYPQGMGPYDPLRGTFGPGGGGGGGMHPSPDDPMFGGSGGQRGYDPRAPPGSRYDPVGPWDTPPSGRGKGPGGRGFGPGGFGGGDII